MSCGPAMLLAIGAGDDAACDGLSSKAKRQAQRLGAWLGQQVARGNLTRPRRVLTQHLPAARTSAEKAMKAAGWTADGIETACDELSGLARGDLLVGTAEWMSSLPDGDGLRPGRLRVLSDPSRDIRAKHLPKGFPYPGPDGAERRKRPAYYYTQSGVIVWRNRRDGPEVLLITSSSGRRWTIPKGIVEPGLTPAESAAQEAREEAGLIGEISEPSIGTYTHHKWGASCSVELFAMTATRELATWETHRQRVWLPLSEASERIEGDGLRQILSGFRNPG